MNFSLDPSSGFADSYLDVEFSVIVPDHPKTVISIHNETSGDQLQILGTSFGQILDGDTLVLKERTTTTGHINIFNNDKMNKKFLVHHSVTLKCVAKFYDDNDKETGEEEESVVFYNEMHSLDAGIIPFDLIIHNKVVNLSNNEALSIDLISDISKKYEICISSFDEKIRCNIEIAARKGKTSIKIPGEFLYHDLEFRESKFQKKFKIFYVKYQGTTISRMSNRRYFPIPDSEIDFQISEGLTPLPQSRTRPDGIILSSEEFIISDRYLVMCPSQNSGFYRKGKFGREKLMDLTMMINEGQHVYALSKKIQQFESAKNADNIDKTAKSLQLANQAHQAIRRPKISSSQIQLMQSVSRSYDAISSKIKPQQQIPTKQLSGVQSFSAMPKKQGGCAPCSRKRNKNA